MGLLAFTSEETSAGEVTRNGVGDPVEVWGGGVMSSVLHSWVQRWDCPKVWRIPHDRRETQMVDAQLVVLWTESNLGEQNPRKSPFQ